MTYIATGTRANYDTTGSHQHDWPGPERHADAEWLSDVVQNLRGYWYNSAMATFTEASGESVGASAVSGLAELTGNWGDQQGFILDRRRSMNHLRRV